MLPSLRSPRLRLLVFPKEPSVEDTVEAPVDLSGDDPLVVDDFPLVVLLRRIAAPVEPSRPDDEGSSLFPLPIAADRLVDPSMDGRTPTSAAVFASSGPADDVLVS